MDISLGTPTFKRALLSAEISCRRPGTASDFGKELRSSVLVEGLLACFLGRETSAKSENFEETLIFRLVRTDIERSGSGRDFCLVQIELLEDESWLALIGLIPSPGKPE